MLSPDWYHETWGELVVPAQDTDELAGKVMLVEKAMQAGLTGGGTLLATGLNDSVSLEGELYVPVMLPFPLVPMVMFFETVYVLIIPLVGEFKVSVSVPEPN